MIEIEDKSKCCGCSACAERCPVQCITMQEDREGFLYPKVDHDNCINCGLCQRVCPVINQQDPRTPQATYAVKSRDHEAILKSSSGGLFSLLAQRTLERGGVLFGARFNDEWEVIHSSAHTVEQIAPFRGSKYLQSRLGDSFSRVKSILEEGREVLFSGTPCQIAGLKCFLGAEYENLITLDFICHGTPSPKVWQRYLDHVTQKSKIVGINFRDKSHSCHNYNFTIDLSGGERISEVASENIYMRGFLSDIYLRPSCYHCPTKSLKSGSDITLADFWGIENILPQFYSQSGVGLVMVNSHKGADQMRGIDAEFQEVEYRKAVSGNPSIRNSARPHRRRREFFDAIDTNMIEKLQELLYLSPLRQAINKMGRFIGRLLARLR